MAINRQDHSNRPFESQERHHIHRQQSFPYLPCVLEIVESEEEKVAIVIGKNGGARRTEYSTTSRTGVQDVEERFSKTVN